MPSHMNFKQLIMLTKKLKIAMTSIALVLLTFAASAQTQVKGTITSSRDGKGIAGAAVVNKNSKAATQTDANGTFSIAAKVGDKIAVSYVGFVTQEVTFLANQTSIQLSLTASEENLEGVVPDDIKMGDEETGINATNL